MSGYTMCYVETQMFLGGEQLTGQNRSVGGMRMCRGA